MITDAVVVSLTAILVHASTPKVVRRNEVALSNIVLNEGPRFLKKS